MQIHKELWDNFSDIYFQEETHKYTDSANTKYRSATGVVSDYSTPTDWDKVRYNKALKELKEERLKTATPEEAAKLKDGFVKFEKEEIVAKIKEIKDRWDRSGKYASTLGTAIHSVMENLWYKKDFNPDRAIFEQFPEMEEDFLYRKKFCKELFGKMRRYFVPIANEFIVYDQPNAVCGTIDFLAYNVKKECYSIIDWKTSKEFTSENKWQKMTGPFAGFDDCNLNHYGLQLSLYKWILEKHTSIRIGEMLLFQIPGIGKTPQVCCCQDMTKIISKIFS